MYHQGVAAMIRSLTVMAIFHNLWLMFGRSIFAETASLKPYRQPDILGDITSVENDSVSRGALKQWEPRGSVNGLVDIGASAYYFHDALIPRLQYKYQMSDGPPKTTTAGGNLLDGIAQELLHNNIIGGDKTSPVFLLSCI